MSFINDKGTFITSADDITLGRMINTLDQIKNIKNELDRDIYVFSNEI